MPIGGRIINRLLFTLSLFLFSLLCADTLFANTLSTPEKIKLKDYWTLCIQAPEVATVECKTQASVGAIENSFEDFNGIAIYKTDFTISEASQNTPLTLYIPHLRDADEVFLNGYLIGQTGQFPPNFEKATLYSRSYPLPNTRLKYGSNTYNELVIRVYNHARQGGLSSGAPFIQSSQAITDQQIASESLLMLFVGIMLIIAAVQGFYFAAQPQNP